ncbi:DUF4194 domain-containing protein [Rathayibacter sp. YIM 133350]|uniref:DUF4194 domain-containing protein n=1 Tax=Rathayibacter sp. YIM 133350 TaxID=3131992 RepID=UPI00307DAD2D
MFDELGHTPSATGPDDFETIDGNARSMYFEGDTGEYRVTLRTAIVKLVRGPLLSFEDDPEAWNAFAANRELVTKHLAEMFLTVRCDPDRKIAFAKQAESDHAFPKLMTKKPLTLVETAVLMYLRQALSQAAGQDYAAVSTEEIYDEIRVFTRLDGNAAGFHKSVENAVDKMVSYNILRPLRGSEGRYSVQPVLRMLFDATQAVALLEAMNTMISPANRATEPEGAANDD